MTAESDKEFEQNIDEDIAAASERLQHQSVLQQAIIRCSIIDVLVLGFFITCYWLPMQSFGSSLLLSLQIPVILLCLACAACYLLMAFKHIISKQRMHAIGSLLCMMSFIICMPLGLYIGKSIREAAFVNFTEHSKPLVQAINAYYQEHQRLPDLKEMLRQHVPGNPATGMGAYPDYELHQAKNPKDFDGNPWMLSVPCSLGWLNFDQVIYYPNQHYPNHTLGGYTEVINDWAYIHE